jgi:hypothetical protein
LFTATQNLLTATEKMFTATDNLLDPSKKMLIATENLFTAIEKLLTASEKPYISRENSDRNSIKTHFYSYKIKSSCSKRLVARHCETMEKNTPEIVLARKAFKK